MNKELNQLIKVTGKLVDNWLPLKIQYDHTPGAVVCIAVNGVPKHLRAFGLSDIDKKINMKKNAQFRVASMSKMFTAVSIMKLQEKGKLRLDDKVVEYISWFKGKNNETNLENVTIRQLLSHSSGISRDGTDQQWVNDEFRKNLKGTISSNTIVFDNGTTMKYSNYGYALLGEVIKKVSGTTYEKFTIEEIIKPLNLKDTLPDLSKEIATKITRGYQRWKPDIIDRKTEPNIKTNAYASATGFISTAKDLAIFLASLHPDAKKSVLNKESRKMMLQVQSIINDEQMYGLGLCIESLSSQQTYGHGGGFAGYVTKAISHKRDNVQVIVLTNTQSRTAGVVSSSVMHLLYKLKDMKSIKHIAKDPYSGIYRNRWVDYVHVLIGDNLIGFSASVNNPAKAWTIYKKKKQHIFKNEDVVGFGDPGENIIFKNIQNGEAQVLKSDGGDMKRIDIHIAK
jgi:D-alanyl-D-alanine carboxypeptidase